MKVRSGGHGEQCPARQLPEPAKHCSSKRHFSPGEGSGATHEQDPERQLPPGQSASMAQLSPCRSPSARMVSGGGTWAVQDASTMPRNAALSMATMV